MDFFAWLDGISGWWWIALALVLGSIELLTLTYFLLWIACAALTVGVALFVADIDGVWQLTIFAVLGLMYPLVGWFMFPRLRGASEASGLNEPSARLVGRQGVVRAGFATGLGAVEIDGVRWRARLAPGVPPPEEGRIVAVTAAEGMTLVVAEPVPPPGTVAHPSRRVPSAADRSL